MASLTLQLPVETWTHIAGHLCYPDQLSFLNVSRLFHSIAIRYVFACIKIHFVAQSFTEVFESYPYFTRDMKDITKRLLRRSWEKLEYIIDNPGFANSVKVLSVIASATGCPSVFEQLTLSKALKTMSNLTAFYWFGNQPELPYEVTSCLPSQLRSLHIQSAPELPMVSSRHLRLMKVERLQIETLFYIPPRMHSMEPDISFWSDLLGRPGDALAALDSMWSPHLRQLSMLSKYIDSMPMQKFSLLTELNLSVTGGEHESDLKGLDLVFHHTPLLESLSVVGFIDEDIFLMLPNDPAILPRLMSFRLLAEMWSLLHVTEAQLEPFSRFLGQKRLLRRLCLRLGGTTWNVIESLLPTIRQLQNLEVFGLNAGGLAMTAKDYSNLASVLTPRMSSIQLVIPWEYLDTLDVDVTKLSPLLERLEELPHLRFIHLYSIGRILPIAPDDLVTDLVHLHTLGYDRSLWDVHDGRLSPWDPWRVQYAIDDDFDCLDDAWLFRHL